MSFFNSLSSFGFQSPIRFTRHTDGSTFHTINSLTTNFKDFKKLETTLANYAVFNCLKITADICSQVEFFVKKGDELTKDDPLIDLLNKPNFFQHKKDFIKEWIWYKLTYGYVVQRPVLPSSFTPTPKNTQALFNLNPRNISFKDNFKTPMLFLDSDFEKFKRENLFFRIDDKKKIPLEIGGLMFTYDVTNGLSDDFFLKSPSRLDAITKAISNVDLTLDAENIMLQTNGRELFSASSGKGQNSGIKMPMAAGDREEIINKLINTYGLSRGKSRSIVTTSGVDWKSLHIELKELGLNESSVKNGSIIRSIFQIPETVFKFYLEKGDTFENKKEGEISLIQDVAQVNMDDFASTFTNFFNYKDTPLVADFSHMPAMQHVEDKKADKLLKISAAIKNLQQAGLTSGSIENIITEIGIDNIKIEENGN